MHRAYFPDSFFLQLTSLFFSSLFPPFLLRGCFSLDLSPLLRPAGRPDDNVPFQKPQEHDVVPSPEELVVKPFFLPLFRLASSTPHIFLYRVLAGDRHFFVVGTGHFSLALGRAALFPPLLHGPAAFPGPGQAGRRFKSPLPERCVKHFPSPFLCLLGLPLPLDRDEQRVFLFLSKVSRSSINPLTARMEGPPFGEDEIDPLVGKTVPLSPPFFRAARPYVLFFSYEYNSHAGQVPRQIRKKLSFSPLSLYPSKRPFHVFTFFCKLSTKQ